MRANIALFVVGQCLALTGVALWSLPLALILAGTQCAAIGLLRDETAWTKATSLVRRGGKP